MITFPHAKINLGLNVTGKRSDGYHEVQTLMYPVPLTDILEIIPANHFNFSTSGIAIEGKQENNLVIRAYQMLKEKCDLPPVSIHLHKTIPMGAGLGGGSSDAAFVLRMLNEIFDLCFSNEELEKQAALLGADCPFFIQGIPAMATGTGTTLKPFSLNLHGYHLLIISSGLHVSTAVAYAGIAINFEAVDLTSILQLPPQAWKDRLFNTFEDTVFKLHPGLKQTKDMLYQQGAVYAGMSGSGSAMFGIFSEKKPYVPESSWWFPL